MKLIHPSGIVILLATLPTHVTATTSNLTFDAAQQPVLFASNDTLSDDFVAKANVDPDPRTAAPVCRTVQVAPGDGCALLATKCGITDAQLALFNGDPNFCATLKPDQYVCCTAGVLPDLSPRPNSDGSCAIYRVQAGDWCDNIAIPNHITSAQLELFNKKTWGWGGCANLQAGQAICLSAGLPPMPEPISSAICGPQVPGTKDPKDGNPLELLNPCPLNACCNIWGQCGITDDFCTASKSSSGAPGTSAPGVNGCISHCGTAIVGNMARPANFMKVGYFEAWGVERECLYMDITSVDVNKFTHLHFSFGMINSNYQVDVSAVQDQFNKFVQLKGIKRILSFGGWSFSTEADSAPIFREGVTDANRLLFATSVANYVKQYNLDGVDFDWEYPGAPDIPGIPPGGKNDGLNYLNFLKMVKAALPAGKTVSIAAPASYWYLKGFPIKEMATVIDYIIYMTYDLHGQWDYGNTFASPGCPAGSCLRSHVNLTETMSALSMITKAGVPASKVVVGVSSYGRSFQMSQAGCTGPMCTFTGPESGATAGRCTKEPGYIANAEMDEIIRANPGGVLRLFDVDSDSDILIYDNVQWVSYMSDKTKESRTQRYQALNFLGTTDWAIDLQEWIIAPDPTYDPCEGQYNSLEEIEAAANIPSYCVNQYIMAVESKTMSTALQDYTTILSQGYDAKFKTYAQYVKQLVPKQLDAYMTTWPSKYFSCIITKYVKCCRECQSAANCVGGCDNSKDCVSGYRDTPATCPASIPTDILNAPDKYTYVLNNKDGFLADLMSLYGIDPTWVKFGDKLVFASPGCWSHPANCNDNIYWSGYPMPNNVVVPDPKALVSSALEGLTSFDGMLSDAAANAAALLYSADQVDAVSAASIPVFMASYAVKSMSKVIEIAGEVEESELEELIMGFVVGILMLIPAVGEIVDAAGLALLGRIITLAGEAGNAALGIYGFVKDPESIVFALFGLLLHGKGGVKDEEAFTQGGIIKRGMSAKDIGALGPEISASIGKVDRLKKNCI